MRKITLFAMLFVGILAARAEYTFVGSHTGDIELAHFGGTTESVESQSLTISEVDGKVNVTFPSFKIMTGTELGIFTIEDVAVTDNEDGTYALAKEQFTISVTTASGMTSSYGYCAMIGEVYADGGVAISVDVVQNPSLPAPLTTATFYSSENTGGDDEEPSVDIVSPIAACYGGELKLTHGIPVLPESTESDKYLLIEKATDSTAVITFPSVSVLGRTATGDITIEDVAVNKLEDDSYVLAKDSFAIQVGEPGSMVMYYNYCSLSGTVSANGEVTVSANVSQMPTMVQTTGTFTGKVLDSSTFVWGKAQWNTEDNVVYESIEDFNSAALTLSYPNPTGFNLGFLNVVAVEYDLYIDDAETPVKASSSAQASADVAFSYHFAEGHDYKIVTTKAVLAQANLATYTTDTLSTSLDSYEISFTINGPEIVKTIEVENWMSLGIIDQNYTMTVSKIDVTEITSALGIADVSEAVMHPLRVNGSYCDYMDTFDWWRDADGEFTNYNGGYNFVDGHNAYPAVYCIKVNEAADSVTYYFYDVWREIVVEEESTVGGSTLTRAPETVYSNDTVVWDNGDGTTTTYRRSYRVEEGKDYCSSVMYVANGKAVILNATLHFVSEEEWEDKTSGIEESAQVAAEAVEYYSIAGVRQPSLQKGINIVRYADGTTRKVMVK